MLNLSQGVVKIFLALPVKICIMSDMDYIKQMAKWAKRRAAIRALRAKQMAWSDIAKRYKITPQRAQQIGKAK